MTRLRRAVAVRLSAGRLGTQRLPRRLGASPEVAYIGGHGDDNLGDNAMFEVARGLLSPNRLETYRRPFVEQRLGRVGLSGRSMYRAAVLGGGTLINPLWWSKVDLALRQGLRLWTLGTGVGSCGFGQAELTDLEPWRPLLARFEGLGVRGPRSAARLAAWGMPAEVIGDLALASASDAPTPPADPPRVALNLTLPAQRRGQPPPCFAGVRAALARLVERGWRVVPVAMNPGDRDALASMTKSLANVDDTRLPRTCEACADILRPCRFTVAVRLHAAVFSCGVGVPPLMLGYREKCLDFMESLGWDAWHLDLDAAGAGEAAGRIYELAEHGESLRPPLLRAVHAKRSAIRDYARRVVEAVAPAAGAGPEPRLEANSA